MVSRRRVVARPASTFLISTSEFQIVKRVLKIVMPFFRSRLGPAVFYSLAFLYMQLHTGVLFAVIVLLWPESATPFFVH